MSPLQSTLSGLLKDHHGDRLHQLRHAGYQLSSYTTYLDSSGPTAVRGELTASCGCDACAFPGLVLDPFFGAGTTALAAEHLRRNWLGIELSPGFAAVARRRLQEARAGPDHR
jgi:hypothetical protein